jgi:hypothetical protein
MLCCVEWREEPNRQNTAIFWRLLYQIYYLQGRYADSYLQISHVQIQSTNKIMVTLYVPQYIGTKNQAFQGKKGANGHFSIKKMVQSRTPSSVNSIGLTKLQP